jgi:sec-independent protein translocase protein TatC
MIKKQAADDLFEKSSMTFGEHLDELRRAMAKAFIWLGLGSILGLMLADRIVRFIETPLKSAIKSYYIERAKLEFKDANGVAPDDEMAAWMTEESMMPQRAFVDPVAIAKLLQPKPTNGDTDEKTEKQDSEKLDQAASDSSTSSTTENESSGGKLEHNPWKGVEIERLKNLEPFILWQPIPNKLVTLTSMEPFMMWLKAGLIAGIIFGAPGIFYHIWQFFAAGLYPHERRYVYWYLPLSLLLFFAGVGLAFFVIFKLVLSFLIGYTTSLDVEFTPRLTDYMSFAMMLPLGFGLAFQLPIVMLGLHRFNVVTAETFLSQWRIAVLVISFLAMVLTPADPYSMVGLALPLVVLYFFGILLCHYMPKGAGIGSPALDP